MGIFNWLNVGGQVVDLASNIAGLLSEDSDEANGANYDLGSVVFALDQNQHTWVGNPTANDMLMMMSQTQLQPGSAQPGTATTPVLISANGGNDISQPMQLYQSGGTFAVAPVSSTSDTLTNAISFAIRSVAIASTVSIVNGVTANGGRQADGTWAFTIKSTGPTLTGGTITVTDQNNVTASAQVTFTNPDTAQDVSDGTAILPESLLLSPTITALEIVLEMSSTDVRALSNVSASTPLKDIPVFKNLKPR